VEQYGTFVVISFYTHIYVSQCRSHKYTVHVTYEEIYKALIFLISIYIAGVITKKLRMPALVGEIIAGFLLGPSLADFVPYPESLVLFGEFGLIFLILEAGIQIDVAQLKQTGTKAIAIAFVGSILSVWVGILAALFNDRDMGLKGAFAVGASFAPTSLGVAASALSSGNMVNTPVGQLIIAACVLDSVIGLILLSMFEVLVKEDLRYFEYVTPLISSVGFLILLGYPAVSFVPESIEINYLPSFSKKYRETAMFGLLLVMSMVYLPLLKYSKASYLIGAFLAGASFSQVNGAYDKFMHHVQSIMEWLLRIFFATTIGFQVPVVLFQDPYVIYTGLFLWVTCVTAKFITAYFVPHFFEVDKETIFNPYKRDVLVTSLSMTCRGELSFIIATFALSKNLISPEMYASVVFAVLFSAITSPYLLIQVISHFKAVEEKLLQMSNPITKGGDEKMPLHLHISLELKGKWGLMNHLHDEMESLGLNILDFRTHAPRGINPTIVNNIRVRDTTVNIAIPTVNKDADSNSELEKTGIQIVADQSLEESLIEEREREVQKTLYENMKDYEISGLDVEQWNPWDWTAALDTTTLQLHNGKVAGLDFLLNLFDIIDDGSDDVDEDELYKALLGAGIKVTKEGLQAMIAVVDEDESGLISREEWEKAVVAYFELKKSNKKLSLKDMLDSHGNTRDAETGKSDLRKKLGSSAKFGSKNYLSTHHEVSTDIGLDIEA